MQPVSSTRRILAAAIAAALLPAVVQADPTNDELLQKIEELSQKVLVLERKLEIQDEATTSAVATTPVVKASPNGFSIASADSKNQLKLRGMLHFDGRYFESDDPEGLKDTWQATRVRPIVEGTLGGIYDFRFTPDFGQGRTVIHDAYVTGRFDPGFQVTAGKFKAPVGLERIQSASDIRMVARGFPTQLVPNRDIGLQVAGGFGGDRLSYAVAYLNGVERRRQQRCVRRRRHGRRQGIRGTRLRAPVWRQRHVRAARPRPRHCRHLHFADRHDRPAAAADLPHTGTADLLPLPHRHDPDSRRRRTHALAPQFYYYVGRFGLLGEYATVRRTCRGRRPPGLRNDTVDTNAWQLAGLLVPDRRGGVLPGFKPGNVFSLTEEHLGRIRTRRTLP